MEIEQSAPIGVIKIPRSKILPGSFIVRNKGNCMDSDKAVKRVKNGDYMLCHPVELREAVGKVVVLSTTKDHYTKQVVRLTKKNLIVCCFEPYRANIFIPLSDIMRIYSVDEVLDNPTIENINNPRTQPDTSTPQPLLIPIQ